MTIEVTGISANYPVPGDFFEVSFGVGPANGGLTDYAALLLGNMTTAGTATADTVVYGPSSSPVMQSETDVTNLFGTGSELHRMWRRFRQVNKTTTLYAIAASESAGTAASTTLVLANTSTGACTLRIFVGDDSCDVPVANGDVIGTIGAAAVIQINNKTEWPVTASFNTATITLTAKIKGPRGNEIRVRAHFVDGTTATTVTPNNTSTAMTSGATSDSWTTALATILPNRYYYIVSPDTSVSGTTFDDLVTQVIAQALPASGIRQRVIAAYVGTQSGGSTIAANAAINTPRAQMPWLQTPEWTAGEIAAHVAAVLSQFEDSDWAYNFRDFGKGTVGGVDTSQFWRLPTPFTQANWPTSTSIATALNNGLMPIGANAFGTYITTATTTKHKNGSNFDYRVRSSHIVSVIDRWTDELQAEYSARFGAKQLADDPRTGEKLPARSVVTPRQIQSLIFEKIDKYAGRYLKQADLIKAGVEVTRDTTNLSRVGARIPLRVIDLLLQNVVAIDDNSTAL